METPLVMLRQCDGKAEVSAVIVHDAVPGRLRMRCAKLREGTFAARRLIERLQRDLADIDVTVNAATGAILLRFDTAMPAARIAARVTEVLNTPARAGAAPDRAVVEIAGRPALFPRMAEKSRPVTVPATRRTVPWHALGLADILNQLELSASDGLSGEEALLRRRRYGANAMPVHEPPSSFALFVKQFDSLPVKMLAGSAALSVLGGGVADAVATMAIVALNGVLGFVTEGQAERTIQHLTAPLSEKTTVYRDGAAIELPIRDLVPGDRLRLRPGMTIAADARILHSEDLLIDESALTGESVPIEKYVVDRLPTRTLLSERANVAYAGTLVAAGEGEALIVATGLGTEAAKVQFLSEASERPHAPIEDELEDLSVKLVKLSLLACGAFFGVGVLRGYSMAMMMKDALALAVSAVPEGLPTVATTTLALGLKRMERKGILIRSLDVVENLGALQVVCLDKTGTLTANKQEVIEVHAGETSHVSADFATVEDAVLRELAEIAALNNIAELADGHPVGSSETERALLVFAAACGVDIAALRAKWPCVSLTDRSAKRRFMTTVHGPAGGEWLTLVKGSPPDVLRHCEWMLTAEGRRRLSDEDRRQILARNDALAVRPARVLGFARGTEAPDADGMPSGMTFVGLAAMVDPIRPGARDFIKALHGAGIETVLITGDQNATAEAVARDLDLSNGAPLQVVDSFDIESLDPQLLAGLARRAHVFARVNPGQKLAIVRALQASGRIVGMTGDGVNDGPALKAADIGIAMGQSGTNLARDVANVVIADDELRTLIEAIAQGRSIYRNIRRSLEFLVTTNMSEIAVEMIEAVHGPKELDTPMELLWINLATDVFPGIGLALADPDEDAMNRPPRPRGEAIIPRGDLMRMASDSAVITLSAIASHMIGLSKYGPGPETRGMTFLTLSLGQLFYTLGCQRSDPRKLHIDRLFENRTLDAALLLSIGFAALPFFVPPLGRLLGIAPLGRSDTLIAGGLATTALIRTLSRRGIRFERRAPATPPTTRESHA